jgi:ABC-type polar amino acid transport system ATPase subunit
MLTGHALRKEINGHLIFRDVDVTLKEGQITCLVGPSGAGKTTLLRALSLLDPPSSGKVCIDDVCYTFPLSSGAVLMPPWPRLTVMFQQLFLWPHMTLKENILLPARNVRPDAEEALQELVDLFDMRHFIDRYPNESSLGQRQRVALARSLLLNPRYVLMDEITSSLDVEQVSKILGHLQTLKERGISIFIITHLIGFARRAADQVLFMADGQILEQGGRDILDHPESRRMKLFVSMVEEAH